MTQVLNELADTTVRVAWAQWTALGALPSRRERADSIVDPEALVLVSLALRERERRLWDMLGWWAVEGSTLLSVQRMGNLAAAYPEEVQRRLLEFAYLAYEEGRDHRWKSFGPRPAARPPRSEKLRQGGVELIEAPTLLLRLRSGLGVGVKADLLAFLIGVRASVTVRDLARAVGYTTRAVRRAADELDRARLIRTVRGQPVHYDVDRGAWLRLLEIEGDGPLWRYWQGIFAFITQALVLAESLGEKAPSDYVVASELRRLVREHEAAFRWNRISTPDADRYPGESYLGAFEETARELQSWMTDHL